MCARSSIGQSGGLRTQRLQVQVLPGAFLIRRDDCRSVLSERALKGAGNEAEGEGLPQTDFEADPRVAMGPCGQTVDMGADEYYWTRSAAIRKTASGIEISWDCIWCSTLFKVDYADQLSIGMTWNTFPETIDGTGLQRASYLDTTAGATRMRLYRVRALN